MSNARRATPSQRMQWWIRPGPSRCWASRKPPPSGPSSALGRHAHVLVEDLRVTAVGAELLPGVLHRRHVADDLHARRVGRHDEHRRALARRGLGIGDGHHDQEVGDRAVRGEPLVPVDHPLVAVAHRARGSSVGSEPGVSGSVMLKALAPRRRAAACSQRSFCSAVPGDREDLRVARVRRLVAERRAARAASCRGSRASARA